MVILRFSFVEVTCTWENDDTVGMFLIPEFCDHYYLCIGSENAWEKIDVE